MAIILITGGTGLVGKQLSKILSEKGHTIRILSRKPTHPNSFYWNIETKEIDETAFENVDFIIHLAGAGIADKRWTNKRKQELIASRTLSTALLLTTVQKLNLPLRKFIAASAIGYYGAINSSEVFEEDHPAASDFLASICEQWENSSLQFEQLKIPTTIIRIGIVLSDKGGALTKMNTPIAIQPIGNGDQYIPWIHIEDLVHIFIKAVDDSTFQGIYNAVAPEHQTSKSFSKLLASKAGKLFIPIGVPSLMLKLLFGEMSILLTTGSRVSSKKLRERGFHFKYQNLESAFHQIFKK